ncbi:fasciclin-like arabinogalactan protein 19 [Malania oleifera]|uniref:fasciclin-like arabinogalactan protein 19 n=1 Tax=Malania oleifera TaxID=397392 RepID=UPI0025AE8CE7|nr:fasciclin-like arabinogalactan protein 19 [Malania oleifera]
MKTTKFPGRRPPPMFLLTLSFLFSSSATATATTLTDQDLETAIQVLKIHKYNLFGNAIATSDLRYRLLSGDSFTLFAPPDSDLFSLDMSSVADDYVRTLRLHVLPRRLSLADLRRLSPGSRIESLLYRHHLTISNHRVSINGTISKYVAVDGVRISVPNLYLSLDIAIHGLDGILSADYGSTKNLTGDVGHSSPTSWSNECSRPEFESASNPPPEGTETAKTAEKLSSGKCEEHQRRKKENKREVSDRRHRDKHDEIKHGNFMKYNHHVPL